LLVLSKTFDIMEFSGWLDNYCPNNFHYTRRGFSRNADSTSLPSTIFRNFFTSDKCFLMVLFPQSLKENLRLATLLARFTFIQFLALTLLSRYRCAPRIRFDALLPPLKLGPHLSIHLSTDLLFLVKQRRILKGKNMTLLSNVVSHTYRLLFVFLF